MLLGMAAAHENLGPQSGVTVSCKAQARLWQEKTGKETYRRSTTAAYSSTRAMLLSVQSLSPIKPNTAQTIA